MCLWGIGDDAAEFNLLHIMQRPMSDRCELIGPAQAIWAVKMSFARLTCTLTFLMTIWGRIFELMLVLRLKESN